MKIEQSDDNILKIRGSSSFFHLITIGCVIALSCGVLVESIERSDPIASLPFIALSILIVMVEIEQRSTTWTFNRHDNTFVHRQGGILTSCNITEHSLFDVVDSQVKYRKKRVSLILVMGGGKIIPFTTIYTARNPKKHELIASYINAFLDTRWRKPTTKE